VVQGVWTGCCLNGKCTAPMMPCHTAQPTAALRKLKHPPPPAITTTDQLQGIRKWALAVAVDLLSAPSAAPWLLPHKPMTPMAAGNDELLSSVEDGAELAAWALDRWGCACRVVGRGA